MALNDGEKLLVYFESEQHLVRRLGAAVISCWRDLDGDVRAKLIERAKLVLDEEDDVDIERLIRVHDDPVPVAA